MTTKEIMDRILSIDAGPLPILNGNLLTDEEGNNLVASFIDINHNNINIDAVYNMDNVKKWVIRNSGRCLSKKANLFIYEPFSSGRTDEFIEDTRFNSLEDAIEFLSKWRRNNFHKFVAIAKNNPVSWEQVKDKLKADYAHILPEIDTRSK